MASRWTTNDIAYLRSQAGKTNAATVALALDKTEAAVYAKARKIGVSLAVERVRWNTVEDDVLIDSIKRNVSIYDIAKALGRSEKAVNHRLEYLRGKNGSGKSLDG